MQSNNNCNCYGFIVTLPAGEDTTSETFDNSLVRNLVNDLLRQNISVYWINQNFSTLTQSLNNNDQRERFVKKGDYLIPFTKNDSKDVKLISIITDYNTSSEIDETIRDVEIFKLMSKIKIESIKLNETKIIQHLGIANRYGWPAYLLIAEAGGFFTMEFMLDGEAEKLLNNKDFNCVMWPYTPDPATLSELFYSFLNKNDYDSIRKFVKNGGGYIGSCEGAFTASSGQPSPLSPFSIQRAYKPNKPSFYPVLSFSISDSLMIKRFILTDLYKSKSKITDPNHPLAFGLNSTINELFSGPFFIWTGPNSQINSYYTQLENTKDNSNNPYFLNNIIGTPNWVTSRFGKGNVVLFASHPEFIQNISFLFETFDWQGDKYYGRRILHNALLFAASDESEQIETKLDKSNLEVDEIIQKTKSIDIDTSSEGVVLNRNKLQDLRQNLTNFNNLSIKIFNKYKIEYENTYFEKNFRLLKYSDAISNILINYLEKALFNLSILEKIYAKTITYNTLIEHDLEKYKDKIQNKINNSNEIVIKIKKLPNKILDKLEENKLSLFEKIQLQNDIRNMLSTLEISFKYIPQIFFETIKIVRNYWYNYQNHYFLIHAK